MTITTDLPPATIKRRVIDKVREQAAIAAGLSPMIAKIIAARPFLENECPKTLLMPKLKTLDNPQSLPDIDKAILRLLAAMEDNEIIGIETDHDCDGQTSHAVIYNALTEFFGYPQEKVRSYIGHRLKEGYGLSEALAVRILADEPRPTLIITADNGSSDEVRIAQLKNAGIDVIVTDHHEIPIEGIPQSAYAVINPIRKDSQYPDKFIAGCMVAWLFMAATRQQLMQKRQQEIPSLAALLDFVAVGTIADCVSIARSRNNRAVVAFGMKLIEQGLRSCWQVLLPTLTSPLCSDDLGFKIGPLLNSDGRLSCAFGSVSFLLSQDLKEATQWVTHLQEQNAARKKIQEKITSIALEQAKSQYRQGKVSLCLFLEEGHAGVHGISASRIKDLFGRPVVIFCPKIEDPNFLTGSARSIDGIHLRDVLQKVNDLCPGAIERFGGHQGAAGLTIQRDALELFKQTFEAVVEQQVEQWMLGPVVLTDGELNIENMTHQFISELYSQLEPFGREFEHPAFEVTGKVISLTSLGQTGLHAKLGLVVNELWFESIWFHCRKHAEDQWPVGLDDLVKVIFSPKLQTFRGKKQLSCQVVHVERIKSTVMSGALELT